MLAVLMCGCGRGLPDVATVADARVGDAAPIQIDATGASRRVEDPDNDVALLALLFGDDHGHAWARWQGPSAADESRTATRHVRILKKGRYRGQGRPLAYAITGAADPACSARACSGGILGAALFEQVAGRWQLRSHDRLVDVVGEAGCLPAAAFMRVLTAEGQPPLLAIEWRSTHAGAGSGGIHVYGFVADHLKKVLSIRGWADNTDADDCTKRSLCSDYHTQLTLGQPGGAWPEIIAQRTGVDEVAGESGQIDERTRYRFDGKGAYLEVATTAQWHPDRGSR